MKKISVKQISIFIIIICIMVSIVYWQNRKNSFDYRKKQYIQELSCVPEKPIDKGIIYAEALKQYWPWEMDSIWYRYRQNKRGEHPTGAYDGELDAERIKRKCGLEENIWGKHWFRKDDCFPKVLQNENHNDIAYVYKPQERNYLYKPENNNKDVDFIVKFSNVIYPKNCCKLLTYEEVKNEMNYLRKIKEKEMNNHKFYIHDIKYEDINLLSKLYFLRVFRYDESNVAGGEIRYLSISQCGKVPHFAYFQSL